MRLTFISMCAVLATAVGLCILSMMMHCDALDELDGFCRKAMMAVKEEDVSQAMEYVDNMDKCFEKREMPLEFVANHDLLHEVRSSIVDARIALECKDLDDAWQALERLMGSTDHMRAHESFSMSNLY